MKISLLIGVFLLGHAVSEFGSKSIFFKIKILGECLGVFDRKAVVQICNEKDEAQVWYWNEKHLMNNHYMGMGIYVRDGRKHGTFHILFGGIGNEKEYDWVYENGYIKSLLKEGLYEIGAVANICGTHIGCQPFARRFDSTSVPDDYRLEMQWVLHQNTGHFHRIKQLSTGFCLAVDGSSSHHVKVENCQLKDEHLWRIDDMYIYNKATGNLALYFDNGDYFHQRDKFKYTWAIGAIRMARNQASLQSMWKFEDGFLKNMFIPGDLDTRVVAYTGNPEDPQVARNMSKTFCNCYVGGRSGNYNYLGDAVAQYYWRWMPFLELEV